MPPVTLRAYSRSIHERGNLMKKASLLVLLLVLTTQVFAGQAMEFRFFTQKGYVSFTVPASWPVLNSQSGKAVSLMAFQIPNSADKGTPDSTNLAIRTYNPATGEGKAAIAKIGRTLGSKKPKVRSRNGWTLYVQQAHQGRTLYTIIDAQKRVAGVVASAMIAWPHLTGNTGDYDQQMETIFHLVLDSAYGHIGSSQPQDGQVIRRPAK